MELKKKYRDDGYLVRSMLPAKMPFSKKDIPGYIFNFAANVPWNKMFRRSFVEKHGLRFQPLRQANDIYFVLLALFKAERISVVDEPLITYRINSGIGLTRAAGTTPYCPSQAFEAVWNELEKDPAFTKACRQSFLNKMIQTLFFLWRMLGSGSTARELFDYYKHTFFPRFKIFDQEPSFWYSAQTRHRLDLMRGGECEDLMLYEIRYYYYRYDAVASYSGVVDRVAPLHDSAPVRCFRGIKKAVRKK